MCEMDRFLHRFAEESGEMAIWRETGVPGVEYYYAEEGLYVLRSGPPGAYAYGFVKAGAPLQAAENWLDGVDN